MLDLAFAAGSVSVCASAALVPHVVPLLSLLLTWVRSLLAPKRAPGERSGWDIDLDWQAKRFRMSSMREPAPSTPSSSSPSPALAVELPPMAAGCERLPQPPTPLVSEPKPEPMLLHFPPPGHTWTIVVAPEITADVVKEIRSMERRRPIRHKKPAPSRRKRAA
jgi:hypothetical protein